MPELSLIAKSLGLDVRLLQVRAQPLRWRMMFLATKYASLVALRFGPVRFDVAPLSLMIRDNSGLGTVQSSIVDFYEDVASTCALGPAPVIVDVGANIGQFTNAAKLFYSNARVICFEPDPLAFEDLKVNTARLTTVELHNFGIGKRAESRPFYRNEISVMSSFRARTDGIAPTGTAIELPVRRLDDVIDSEVAPDLLKVDVEGFERQVLEGAWETLHRSRYLLIEISLEHERASDNLHLLHDIFEHAPKASVLRFGRPLGGRYRPMAQDIVISLRPIG